MDSNSQLGPINGSNVLVTSASAGLSVGANAIDGGIVLVRSPDITLHDEDSPSLIEAAIDDITINQSSLLARGYGFFL